MLYINFFKKAAFLFIFGIAMLSLSCGSVDTYGENDFQQNTEKGKENPLGLEKSKRDFLIKKKSSSSIGRRAIGTSTNRVFLDFVIDPNRYIQGSLGSCVAFSTIGILSYYNNRDGIPFGSEDNLPSPSFIFENVTKITPCNGSYFDEALSFVKNNGVCSWRIMPYNKYKCGMKTPDEAWAEAAKNRIDDYYRIDLTPESFLNVLSDNKPILIGLDLDEDFQNIKNEVWLYSGISVGAHALVVTGIDLNEGYILAANSWGIDHHQNGFIKISTEEIGRAIFNAIVIEREPRKNLRPSPKIDDVKEEEKIVDFKVSDEQLFFNDLFEKKVITIKNTGNKTVNLNVEINPNSEILVSQKSFKIQPNRYFHLEVMINPNVRNRKIHEIVTISESESGQSKFIRIKADISTQPEPEPENEYEPVTPRPVTPRKEEKRVSYITKEIYTANLQKYHCGDWNNRETIAGQLDVKRSTIEVLEEQVRVNVVLTKKGGGAFISNGTAYIKLGSVCSGVLMETKYWKGQSQIHMSFVLSKNDVEKTRVFTLTITEDSKERNYAAFDIQKK